MNIVLPSVEYMALALIVGGGIVMASSVRSFLRIVLNKTDSPDLLAAVESISINSWNRIYAHPNPQSLNAAILNRVECGLNEAGHTYTVIDLYNDNFDPVLIIDEEKRRSAIKDDPETAHYRELIQEADHLVFIFPIWWYGAPAILKGFFDRVLASGFAFTYEGLVPKGLLRGKSAWVFYTIDSPKWYARIWRRSTEWVAIGDATLKFFGFRPVKRFVFDGIKTSSERQRGRWLERVYRQARYGLLRYAKGSTFVSPFHTYSVYARISD